MKLRGDVHWVSNGKSSYLKMGEQVFLLAGLPVDKQEEYWEKIKSNIVDFNDQSFMEFYQFLDAKGAFEEQDPWKPYFYQMGIQIDNFQQILATKKVALLGDSDLISKFRELYSNTFLNMVNDLDDSDIGLLLIRSHKNKEIKEFNKLFLDKNIEYIPLLFQSLSYMVGPIIIPDETVCLNCIFSKKEKNLFYRNEHSYFEDVEDSYNTPLPEIIVQNGLNTLVVELVKRILVHEKLAVEMGIINKIVEYIILESRIDEHNVMKDPDCEVCYPSKNFNKEVIWMGKTK